MKANIKTKGKTFNDRLLAGKVRDLTLNKIYSILQKEYDPKEQKEDLKFQRELLLKLSGSILPRLNEHSGQDGEPIQISIVNYDSENTF